MKEYIGNYAKHAQYWDWGGYDRTPENEYWYQYAQKYGNRVLIPMCALGETGAYMAQRGMDVTAFDVVPEMIAEGKKRFGHLPGLKLLEGDVCDFRFDIELVDFAFTMDFGHLQTMEDTKRALKCIRAHLREGGCFVLEAELRIPGGKSSESPLRTYEPMKQVYPGIKVWKTGYGYTEANTGRHYIFQTFYARDSRGNVEEFKHEFYLQSYTREEWLSAFEEVGFEIAKECSDRQLQSWNSSDELCIFELIR